MTDHEHDHERELANLREQIAVLTAEPVMHFADGRQPSENERHLYNLLSWREKEAEQAKADLADAREQAAVTEEQFKVACERSEEWKARAEKAEAFKAWTHAYLDAHGVPHHPPGTHGAEGCRIGDRMDWLMAKVAAMNSVLQFCADDESFFDLDTVDDDATGWTGWEARCEIPHGTGTGADDVLVAHGDTPWTAVTELAKAIESRKAAADEPTD